MREIDLYIPVKTYLESQGYKVKGEIGAADVVAHRNDSLVIVELKLNFSLTLIYQGIERLRVTDAVYLCVPRPKRWKTLQKNIRLCRRLGLGFLTVHRGLVNAHTDPGFYVPQKSKPRQNALLKEFAARQGDPSQGGTQGKIITAYRQDALRIANYLAAQGASKGATVAQATSITKATTIMRTNHYGWFEKVTTGVYQLSQKGRDAASYTNLQAPSKNI